MTFDQIVREVGKGALQRQEWTDAECDYVNCPLRQDVERIEMHNGNVILVILTAMAVGMLIGFLVGVAL